MRPGAGARRLATIGRPIQAVHEAAAQPSCWLRLPAAGRVPYPGQAGEFGVSTKNQIPQCAPREVGRRDSTTDVTARDAEPGSAIEPYGGRPVPWHPEHPAPRLVDRDPSGSWEHFVEQAHQLRDRPMLRATER